MCRNSKKVTQLKLWLLRINQNDFHNLEILGIKFHLPLLEPRFLHILVQAWRNQQINWQWRANVAQLRDRNMIKYWIRRSKAFLIVEGTPQNKKSSFYITIKQAVAKLIKTCESLGKNMSTTIERAQNLNLPLQFPTGLL